MDLMVLPLAQFVSLQLAGKLFLCLTLAVVLTGTVVLHRTLFQHWSLWPLAAALFLYNRLLLWGFLGCLFTVGLSFFALAHWVAIRERAPGVQYLVNTGWAVVIFFGHLFAFGIYAVMVGGYELYRLVLQRRTMGKASYRQCVMACLPLAVPVVMYIAASPQTSDRSIVWQGLSNNLAGLFYPFM